MLDADERRESARKRDGCDAHVCLWGVAVSPAASAIPCRTAGWITAIPVPATARRAGQVHDKSVYPEALRLRAKAGVRCPRDRVRSDRLGETGRLAVDDGARGFRSHVARSEPRSSRCHYEQRSCVRQLHDGRGNQVCVIRHDAAHDVELVVAEKLLQRVAARIVAYPCMNTVGDSENSRPHAGSFVFSTRRTSSMTIALSTAFAMS